MKIYTSISEFAFDENFGQVDISPPSHIDLNSEALELLNNSPMRKVRGRNDLNTYIRVPDSTAELLNSLVKPLLKHDSYEWTWEYYRSGEPVGMHTDYKSFDNIWYTDEPERNVECHVVLGMLIPLSWDSKQPYTLFFNKFSELPKKLIFSKGYMRYQGSNDIYEYQKEFVYDPNVLPYIPKEAEYGNQTADLVLANIYKWDIGTGYLFDTRQWHASSWFLDTMKIPKSLTQSKTGIVGFAIINADKLCT